MSVNQISMWAAGIALACFCVFVGEANHETSRKYDRSYRPGVGHHYVNGYVKQNGAVIQGHYRTNPDQSFYNNWSSVSNRNPFTGKTGWKTPPPASRGLR